MFEGFAVFALGFAGAFAAGFAVFAAWLELELEELEDSESELLITTLALFLFPAVVGLGGEASRFGEATP